LDGIENASIAGREIQRHSIELPAPAKAMQFSPDGSVLAVDVRRVLVYDVASGVLKAELPHAALQPRPPIECKRLLAVDDEGCVLGHAATLGEQPVKAPVVRFSADGTTWETLVSDTRSSVSYLSPDRRLLAVARLANAGPSRIEIWELASGQRVKTLAGHWNRIGSIAFSPDSQQLASVGVSADVIKLWSLADVVSK
jgi:WD40 repeat protein